MKSKCRIGIPTLHSRLHPKVMSILGLEHMTNPTMLSFTTDAAGVYFLRGWDLAYALESDRLDYAFCGKDTIMEAEAKVRIIREYKSMASPIALCIESASHLTRVNEVTIATEYPNLTKKHLEERFDRLVIVHVHGATEAFGCLGGIDGIVDIVESGETLRNNGFEIETELFETYPCLIGRVGTEDNSSDVDRVFSLVREAIVAKR